MNPTEKILFNKIIKEISELDPNELARVDELGKDLNFNKSLNVFKKIVDIYKEISELGLDGISKEKHRRLFGITKDIYAILNNIRNFSPTRAPQNTIKVRDEYIRSISEKYSELFDFIVTTINYHKQKTIDSNQTKNELESIIEETKRIKENFKLTLEDEINDFSNLVDKAKKISSVYGVAQRSLHFKDEADKHENLAKKWLKATIVIAGLTIGWGIIAFFIYPKDPAAGLHDIIHYAIAKLIILSVLFFALAWAGKNYRSHNHNYVTNKHRQNSLNIFETFVYATKGDKETQNAVLLQATQSIFSCQPSGFNSSESDNESPNKIIEIFRTISNVKQ